MANHTSLRGFIVLTGVTIALYCAIGFDWFILFLYLSTVVLTYTEVLQSKLTMAVRHRNIFFIWYIGLFCYWYFGIMSAEKRLLLDPYLNWYASNTVGRARSSTIWWAQLWTLNKDVLYADLEQFRQHLLTLIVTFARGLVVIGRRKWPTPASVLAYLSAACAAFWNACVWIWRSFFG